MILDLAPIAFSCKENHVTPNILQPLERIVPEGFNPVIVCPRQGVIITNILNLRQQVMGLFSFYIPIKEHNSIYYTMGDFFAK